MGAVDTTYTFTATDTITSTKMNNIIDQTTMTSSAIVGTTLEVASGQLRVRSQGITSNELGANSVVTTAIANSNVTTEKIADSSITKAKLAPDLFFNTVESVTTSIFSIGAGDAIPFDNTIPQNTEGEEVLSASITPTSVTNQVLVTCEINCANNYQGNSSAVFALFKGSGANAIATRTVNINAQHMCVVFSFLDSPSTTSSTTYKLRCGYNSGGIYGYYINGTNTGTALFGGTLQSSIRLSEILA